MEEMKYKEEMKMGKKQKEKEMLGVMGHASEPMKMKSAMTMDMGEKERAKLKFRGDMDKGHLDIVMKAEKNR